MVKATNRERPSSRWQVKPHIGKKQQRTSSMSLPLSKDEQRATEGAAWFSVNSLCSSLALAVVIHLEKEPPSCLPTEWVWGSFISIDRANRLAKTSVSQQAGRKKREGALFSPAGPLGRRAEKESGRRRPVSGLIQSSWHRRF